LLLHVPYSICLYLLEFYKYTLKRSENDMTGHKKLGLWHKRPKNANWVHTSVFFGRGSAHYHLTLDPAVLWTPSNDTSRPVCSDILNLMPPAPLYLRTLWHYTNAVIIIIIFKGPTSTKPQTEILKVNNVNGCNDISFHSRIIVFWNETAFPRWRAMDRHWKKNSVSLVSSVTTVMCRPISCITSMAVSCHAPAVSMANEWKWIRRVTKQN